MSRQQPDLWSVVRAFQVAMTDEHVDPAVIERTVNRVVYGEPCGPSCVRYGDLHLIAWQGDRETFGRLYPGASQVTVSARDLIEARRATAAGGPPDE